MADAVEAASKSLKEPTIELLKDFVDKIVDQQMDEKQFMNSNITLSISNSLKRYSSISLLIFTIYVLNTLNNLAVIFLKKALLNND